MVPSFHNTNAAAPLLPRRLQVHKYSDSYQEDFSGKGIVSAKKSSKDGQMYSTQLGLCSRKIAKRLKVGTIILRKTPGSTKIRKSTKTCELSETVTYEGWNTDTMRQNICQASQQSLHSQGDSIQRQPADQAIAKITENIQMLEAMFNPNPGSQSLLSSIKLAASQIPKEDPHETHFQMKAQIRNDLPQLEALFASNVSQIRAMLRSLRGQEGC